MEPRSLGKRGKQRNTVGLRRGQELRYPAIDDEGDIHVVRFRSARDETSADPRRIHGYKLRQDLLRSIPVRPKLLPPVDIELYFFNERGLKLVDSAMVSTWGQ